MKLFNHVFSIAAALALVGCGSGGGGGAPPYIDVGYSGPTTTVTITSTANIGSLVTAANGGVTTLASSVDTGVVAVGSAAPGVTVKAALAALSKLRAGGGTVVSGVTDSQTQACAVSGSVTLGYTMADPSGYTVSAGDRFSVTFNACNDGPGYGIIAGSETVIVGASPGGASFFSDPTTMAPGVIYSMTVLISDFVIVDDLGYYSGIDGDMTVAMTFTTDDPYATSGWLTSSESGSGISFEAGFDKVATESAKLTGIAGGHYSMESGAYYPYGLYDWPDAYQLGRLRSALLHRDGWLPQRPELGALHPGRVRLLSELRHDRVLGRQRALHPRLATGAPRTAPVTSPSTTTSAPGPSDRSTRPGAA